MKINLVPHQCVKHETKVNLFCGIVYSAVIIFLIIAMHAIYAVPPTVITAPVIPVSAGEFSYRQIIRGNRLNLIPFEISYDRETWHKRLPVGCDITSGSPSHVALVYVRDNSNGTMYETAVIIQDLAGQCESGP